MRIKILKSGFLLFYVVHISTRFELDFCITGVYSEE